MTHWDARTPCDTPTVPIGTPLTNTQIYILDSLGAPTPLGIPGELMDKNPEITVKINGRVADRFHTTEGYFERNVRVTPAPNGAPNVLELSIDKTLSPPRAHTGDDGRTLGLRLRYLAWGPA